MPGHPVYTLGGTDTVEVSVPVAKGQGLEVDPSNPGKVRPWSAGSTTRVGVAQVAARPAAGNPVNDYAPLPRMTTAQRAPQVVRMQFAANAAWRAPLVAAANGQVTPAADPSAIEIVGWCDQAGGVLAGASGAVELR